MNITFGHLFQSCKQNEQHNNMIFAPVIFIIASRSILVGNTIRVVLVGSIERCVHNHRMNRMFYICICAIVGRWRVLRCHVNCAICKQFRLHRCSCRMNKSRAECVTSIRNSYNRIDATMRDTIKRKFNGK